MSHRIDRLPDGTLKIGGDVSWADLAIALQDMHVENIGLRELLERAAPFVESAKESSLTDAAWARRAQAWLSELRDAV